MVVGSKRAYALVAQESADRQRQNNERQAAAGNNVAPQRILPISICCNLLHKLFSSDVTREYFFRKTKGYAEARS